MRARRQADYDGWPDRRVPALDGRTPREVVATPDGRHLVEALMVILESREAEFAPGERIDLAPLRRTLGCDDPLPEP
jgi:hypothetical protein